MIDFTIIPIDIKFAIASTDEQTWIWLALRDDSFYEYSRNNRLTFIKLFNVYTVYNESQIWKLFDKIYRHNDLPAVVKKFQRDDNGLPRTFEICPECVKLGNHRISCNKHRYIPEYDTTLATEIVDNILMFNTYQLYYYKYGKLYKRITIDWFY